MREDNEAEILAGCRRGDTDAWDQLFDLHYAPVYRFVFQLGFELTPEDVEEICQETFLAVIRSLSSFKGGSRFQTWVFRIAANKAKDFRAKARAAKRGGGIQPLSLQAEDPETGLEPQLPAATNGPDKQMIANERMLGLQVALDELGAPCRQIIQLRYYGDLSYDELARALKLSPKTVSSRLSRCLDRLEVIAKAHLEMENSPPSSV